VEWEIGYARSYSMVTTSAGNQKYDYIRTTKFITFGTFLLCPLMHAYTAKLLPALFDMSKGGRITLVKKLLFDQTIGASSFNALFLVALGFMDTFDIKKSLANLKERFVPTMLMNWGYWPLINYFNFGKVPVEYQVLVMNVFALLWNAAMSYIQNVFKKSKTT